MRVQAIGTSHPAIGTSHPPAQPLAFVVGLPRSGTTLLAKLLDSHPSVLYLHEPLSRSDGLLIHDLIRTARDGVQPDDEVPDKVISELIRRRADYLQPPFFYEDFARVPWGAAIAWAWKKSTGHSWALPAAPRDLRRIRLVLVKDGLASYVGPLTRLLQARTVVILRHPCGVVNSILRGRKIGEMPQADRGWYWEALDHTLRELGYDETDVRRMQDDEFEALQWLVSSREIPALTNDPSYKVVTYARLFHRMEDVVDEIFPWLGLDVRPSTRAFAAQVKLPSKQLLRHAFGARKMYYSLTARSERPDLAWQTELPLDSQRRILKIVETFPLERFWPSTSRPRRDPARTAS